ncbi:MAG: DUF6850 family outer membrane beta-barrel protein [Cyclobacteriaceae bacterium]
MKIFVTAVLFFILNVGVLADPGPSLQAQGDSVQFPTFFSFYRYLYQAYEHSTGQVLFHPSERYGLSSAAFSRASGDWRTFQMPGSSRHYQVSSKGAYRLNKVRLIGEFGYQRRQDDSLGWMLKPDQHDRSPYYLANKKAGNWDAHTYLVSGAGSLPVAGPMYFTAGARLNLGTYGRFTDPRPEISRYRLRLSGGLGYRYQKLALAISAVYGYGDEQNHVGYASEINRTIGRQEYILQDIMGYGYYRRVGSNLSLNEENRKKGLEMAVRVGRFNFSYVTEQSEREYFRRASVSGQENDVLSVGDVFQKSHSLKATYFWGNQQIKRLLGLDVCIENTRDFNHLILKGNNYRGNILSVRPAYQIKKGNWEYHIGSGFERENRKDGTAAVDYLVQTASLAIGGGKLFSLKNSYLKLDVETSYRTDAGSRLLIESQYNEFMKGVVLPDFTFYSSEQFSQYVSFGYGFKTNEVVLMPSFSFNLVKPINAQDEPEAEFLTGDNRIIFSFSLNIHM